MKATADAEIDNCADEDAVGKGAAAAEVMAGTALTTFVETESLLLLPPPSTSL